MTAPTEAEIRAAVDEGLEKDPTGPDFGDVIYRYTSNLDWDEDQTTAPGVWRDLRPSERERLRELLSEVYEIEETFHAMTVEAAVKAALTFAAEFPDVPRAG